MRGLDDTIVAISTPLGAGAIAVVRVTGPRALEVARRLTRDEKDWRPNVARVREVYPVDGEEVPLDVCVVTYFRGPHSYTGEDTVEISCHGGGFVARRVVEECLRAGARLAEPGEFTRRAFLNGKLDLTQAEAVAGIIYARSEERLKAAVRQYRGELAGSLRELRAKLIALAGRIELELDFAEEDVEFASREEIEQRLREALGIVDRALSSYRRGKRIWEGIRVVLVGKPNVGKSSLLNALLEEERAIVTEVPGTTRDTVEDEMVVNGLLFRLVDTAGLRKGGDAVEILGIDRTWREVERADVVVWIVDSSVEPEEAMGEEAPDLKARIEETGADLIVVLNKIDLPQKTGAREVARRIGVQRVVEVSAKTGEGLERLVEALVGVGSAVGTTEGEVLLTSLRQFEAMQRAREALQNCLESAVGGRGGELIAVDLREAIDAIGSVTGEVTTDEILDEIFADFCIGK